MNRVFLGLGSNIGDRKSHLDRALSALSSRLGRLSALSSYYETEPWGVENQEPYLNLVAEFETTILPLALLEITQEIETAGGRVRGRRWASRTLDIDILFYSKVVAHFPNLILPHPRIAERNFVLWPMSEIASDFIHPQLTRSINELKDLCPDQTWIRKCEF